MLAIGLDAVPVKRKRMILQVKPAIAGYAHLPRFDFAVDELLDPAALQADEVVVVLALVQLKERPARFKIAAFEDTGLFELGEHAIHRREPDVVLMVEQLSEHILRAHMTSTSELEDLQDLEPGGGCLEAAAAQFER